MPSSSFARLTGSALAVSSATLFAVNSSAAKMVMTLGIDPQRMGQLRATGAMLVLLLGVIFFPRLRARIPFKSGLFLALVGILGIALQQWTFLVSVQRLPVALALTILYLYPLLTAVFVQLFRSQSLSVRLWLSIGTSLVGVALMLQVWDGLRADLVGLGAGIATVLLATAYVLLLEHLTRSHSTWTIMVWGYIASALLWALFQPLWTFPVDVFDETVLTLGGFDINVALAAAFIAVCGTLMPWMLYAEAQRKLPAPVVGVIAKVEILIAVLIAWWWLDETLTLLQMLGGALVVGAVVLVQFGELRGEGAAGGDGERPGDVVASPAVSAQIPTPRPGVQLPVPTHLPAAQTSADVKLNRSRL